ncbi:AraC family transcriptional regulator [Moritella sp. F3]|uniref:AraC family transcriptional regulator n=1 Tax=Moritella sp. F3 TaxID=2718882 RepID=UPI0018E1A8C8|nr:AraC family transcriptional regulator [Moritella sp. F3]GIC79587.1 AraC family transcriptional regulator [Moritella sp. F1]GIC79865.1 AraC family transcriptional regulator [Moritella sp. F3]
MQDAGMLLRIAYEAMKELEIDVTEVLSRCNISEEVLNDKDLRTPNDAQTHFWQVLEDISQDPNIGISLGERMPVFTGQVLQYLFLSSPTFGTGWERATKYFRLISDAASVSIKTEGNEARLSVNLDGLTEDANRHLNDCLVIGAFKFCLYVTESEFKATKIAFAHARPKDITAYTNVFTCPIEFSAEDNYIYFDADLLERPSSHAEPELFALHDQLASRKVAKLELQDLVDKVRKVIAQQLESGVVTLESIATELDMKPRMLRAKLADIDYNFNQILADFRCELSKKLLANTDESIDQIVYLTGFSEPSTFYRAFKRWVKMTPIEYRRSKHVANNSK